MGDMEKEGTRAADTLATQGGITLIGRLISKLFGFLFLAVVTRLVSPSVYGVYTLALSIIVVITSLAHLSLHKSLDYFLPQFLDVDQFARARGLLVQVVGYSLGFSIVAAVALWLLADQIANLFNTRGLTALLSVFTLAIPLRTLNDVLMSFYNSIKVLKYRVYTQSITLPSLKFGVVLLLLPYGFDEFGILTAYISGLILAIVIGSALVVKSEDWLRSFELEKVSVRRVMSYSAPLAFAGIIYSIVGYVDFFIIGYFRNPSDVGVYRVSYFLTANLVIFLSSFAPIFKPMIAESKDNSEALQSTYRLATRWATILTFPAAITLALAPITYLTLLFDASYAVTPYVVMILTVGYLVNAGVGPEGMMLEGLGYTRLTLVNTTVMILLNVILDILLVPVIGIVGAAIGTSVAMATAVILAVFEIYYIRDIVPFDTFTARVWSATLPPIAVGFILTSFLGDLTTALVLPPVVSLCYILMLRVVGGFAPEDRTVAERIDKLTGYVVFQRIVPDTVTSSQ